MNIRFFHRLARGAAAMMMLAGFAPAMAADYAGEPAWRNPPREEGYPDPVPPPPSDYRQPYQPYQSYKDDAAPPPPLPAPRRRVVAECLSKYGIRESLNRQGWHEFANVEIRDDVAYMIARNDNGRAFDLQVDSCTGEVFEAHPRAVYVDRPVYYERYYAPRPSVGLHFGVRRGYGHHGHRW